MDVSFQGIVLPRPARFTAAPLELDVAAHGSDAPYGHLHATFEAGAIAAELLAAPNELHTREIHDVVLGIISSYVNLLGWQRGAAYQVELETLQTPGRPPMAFGAQQLPVKARERWKQVREEDLQKILFWEVGLVLRRALSGLSLAARQTTDTGFHAYRAVESVAQHFRRGGSDKKQAWIKMRAALNLSEEFLAPLREAGAWDRHGDLEGLLPRNDRLDLVTRAWEVVDRFNVLLVTRQDSLPLDEFPVLVNLPQPRRIDEGA